MNKEKKRVYFIGIAGKTMAPLAKAFKDLGWVVSGSDQKKVYPPVSTYLEQNKIHYFKGYRPENLSFTPDLIVVGRSSLIIDPQNPEYLKARGLVCPVLSYPEVLQKYLIKDSSIVVAGTYGKTTISALLAWILIKAGFNPSYMAGGIPLNMGDGVRITDSVWSVVEGDEPPALLESDPPKFMYYKPKFLFLTSVIHDHPEIFKTKEDYWQAFINLVRLLPKDGLLIYNKGSVEKLVVEAADCPKISYSFNDQTANYFVKNFSRKETKTVFEIQNKNKTLKLETVLLGKHNLENICGAVALCTSLGIKETVLTEAISSFKGIKTRLELLGEFSGRYFYWDLGQHPQKVRGSLEALREHFPDRKIICVFDPVTTGLKYSKSLSWYQGAFDSADQVVVGKVSFLKSIAKEDRVTGKNIVEAIAKTQPDVFYQPIDEKIISWLIENSKGDDLIIFLSSGGLRFTKLIEKTISKFKKL